MIAQQARPILDYAPAPPVREVFPVRTLLSALPGVLAVPAYLVAQYARVSNAVGFIFWSLMLIGIVIAFLWLLTFRRRYRRRARPWFVWLTCALHTLILLGGAVFITFFLMIIFGHPW